MTNGTSNHAEALQRAAEALRHLEEAERLLRAAGEAAEWKDGKADFLHFATAVASLISTDHDEAGLRPTLRLLAR